MNLFFTKLFVIFSFKKLLKDGSKHILKLFEQPLVIKKSVAKN